MKSVVAFSNKALQGLRYWLDPSVEGNPYIKESHDRMREHKKEPVVEKVWFKHRFAIR